MKLFHSSALALALAFSMPTAPAKADSEPLLGDVMIVGFNFCPRGWAKADGQILPINSNQSLFSLMGTTYGGDGRTTFALPDLRGRHIVSVGTSVEGRTFNWGQKSGVESTVLNATNLPSHNHQIVKLPDADVLASSNGPSANSPTGKSLATFPNAQNIYATEQTATTPMGDQSINLTIDSIAVSNAGGSVPYSNIQPTIALTVCVALQGVFPSRN